MDKVNKKVINDFTKSKGLETDLTIRAYSRQAINFTKTFEALFPDNYTGYERQDYIKVFAQINLSTDNYNQDIYNVMLGSENRLVDLSGQHTNEIVSTKGFTFNLSATTQQTVIRRIQDTGNFQLSEAIWSADKRGKIYAEVMDGIRAGLSKDEITKKLESYLIGSPNAGNLYNVNRVADTEFQRAYFQGSLQSTRDFNEFGGDQLFYKRSLSPFHKITDICDSLQGVYDTKDLVPEIPSHPNCRCLIERVFASDYMGQTKKLSLGENNLYTDKKYKQTNIMM